MAVLDESGVGVTIRVDQQDLQEWPDPDPPQYSQLNDAGAQTKIVSKYIISQDDRKYVIRVNTTDRCTWATGNRRVFNFAPNVDGKGIRGLVLQSPGHSGIIEGSEHSNADGTSRLYEFKFSAVKTVDDASKARVSNDMEQAKALGQITVRVWRDYHQGLINSTVSQPHQVESEVAEKALKGRAISHGTSYAEPRRIKDNGSIKVQHSDAHPMAIFVFKYRSKTALQQEMIIPRTPSPDPEREPDGLEGMSQEEIRRLALLGQQKIKHEKEQIGFKRERTLDHEPPSRPLKISRNADGKTTIDLTDD